MEVRIGIEGSPRELVVESELSPDEVRSAITEALAGEKGLLSLTDDKGRQVLVPAAKLTFVEIGEPEARRVGFGSI